jgi:hypothetical protein
MFISRMGQAADQRLIVQPDALPRDCYCFSTVNRKIAWRPYGPLKGHTLDFPSGHQRRSPCAGPYWQPHQFS